MLNMNSNAAKELMTSFLGNFKQSSPNKLPVSYFQCIKLYVYAFIHQGGSQESRPSSIEQLLRPELKVQNACNHYILIVKKLTSIIGYAQTICGRKRWFPHITSGNTHLKSYSERQAINFPIQGGV